jgi:ribosomal protein L29
MKTNIKKELHTKTIAELKKRLVEARDEQRVLKLDQEMGKIKNTSSIANKRVEIAVISTILNEKLLSEKLAAAEEVAAKKEASVKRTPAVKAKKKSASTKASADKEGGKK